MRSRLITEELLSLKRHGLWVITIWFALITPMAMAQQAALNVTLQPVDNGVLFELRNNSTETFSVLRWDTPFEAELSQDVFTVVADRSALFPSLAAYTGRLIKRGTPQTNDFITVNAGESISTHIALTDYYQIADSGLYSVSFSGSIELQSVNYKGKSTDSTQVINLHSKPVTANLRATPVRAYARAGGYNNCSAAQQTQLAQDLNASEAMTRSASSALANLPVNERAGSPRYLQWFGSYSATRYSAVANIYKKAEQTMANGSIEFNCDCNDNFFAYVFPIDPFKVYLCNLYWSAAQTGADSRAGTILHELSHFPEIGGTDDYAYGAADAANLALSNPNNAVSNADSIEYFAENSPFREISSGVATPAPATQYSTLQPGDSVTDFVSLNEAAFYQVSGVDALVLTTTAGDADLSVYADSARNQLLCESRQTDSVDRCDLVTSSTVYIEVLGYAPSQYNLVTQITDMAVVEPPVITEPVTPPTPVVVPEAISIAAVCEDTGIIGDGWGWNGTNSCELPTDSVIAVNSTPLDTTGSCLDADGDGWGWNGTNSCLVATTGNSVGNTDSPAGDCIDTDGDGWGWNGVNSCPASASATLPAATDCIDLDGDGWGWDGRNSCYIRQKQ